MEFVGLAVGMRSKIDDAGFAGVADELPVELRPALRLDLALESAADVEIGAWPQFLGDEVARSVAHAFLDVVAGNHEVLAVVADAAHDQVDVRMLGVPVIDSDPIEPRIEVLLDLADQIAGEGLQVRHLHGVVRRRSEEHTSELQSLMRISYAVFFLKKKKCKKKI